MHNAHAYYKISFFAASVSYPRTNTSMILSFHPSSSYIIEVKMSIMQAMARVSKLSCSFMKPAREMKAIQANKEQLYKNIGVFFNFIGIFRFDSVNF